MAGPNIKNLKDYLGKVKNGIGTSWMAEADSLNVVSYKSLGAVAYEYTTACYINGISVEDCVKTLKEKF